MQSIGQIIANRYQIQEPVYSIDGRLHRAVDVETTDVVLLELYMNKDVLKQWKTVFADHVNLIRNLDHPHIIHLLDHGISESFAFIVMADSPYQTLARMLKIQPRMPLDAVLKHGIELADALGHLHHAGTVHSHITAENIWIFEDGLRLAKIAPPIMLAPDRTNGDLPYTSPESLQGSPITPACDAWSFGVVLFEMLAGSRPFGVFKSDDSKKDAQALFDAILNEPALDLEKQRPGLPKRLVALIQALLTKEPQGRISDMAQIIEELEAITVDVQTGENQSQLTTPLALGQFIGERYQLEEEIGRGAFGRVYRAFDLRTGQIVAIKQLKPQVTTNVEHLERFHHESVALQMLKHPGILTILDTVETRDEHYLVLEYLEGGDLRTLLDDGRLPLRFVLEIALVLADALARAHNVNIIHRDIKPENILIAADGTPRLSDFGVARMDSHDRLSYTGRIVGTIGYIAPEVLHGQMASHLADIWSFGIMLYEMVTGERPFRGEIMTQVLSAILSAQLPDISATFPGLPVELTDLIYAMLERDPLDRMDSMRDVATRLEHILREMDE